MITFISPAMGFNSVNEIAQHTPVYKEKTKEIVKCLKEKSPSDIAQLMKVNEQIAELNFERYQDFSFDSDLFPAIYLFKGLQYGSLDAASLDSESIKFLQNHARIFSGLYGILKPLDGILPYRLEMKTKLSVDNYRDLYQFWGDSLYQNLAQDAQNVIVNLASSEYSKCVEPFLQDETYVTCVFKVNKNGILKVQSTAAKQARGKMLRYIAENKINAYEDLVLFGEDGYAFAENLSILEGKKKQLVFVKEK